MNPCDPRLKASAPAVGGNNTAADNKRKVNTPASSIRCAFITPSIPFQNFPDDTTDVAPGINGEEVTLDGRIPFILIRSAVVNIAKVFCRYCIKW